MCNAEQPQSFKKKVLSSFLWLGSGTFAGQIISWLSTIIVIRLLSPSDYGLLAMSMVVIAFLTLISDMGVGAAIIQSDEISDYEVRQVCGIVFLTSFAGFVVSYLVAPLIAAFFDQPDVTLLVRILSVNFILIAFYSVPQSLFIRDMNFQTKAKVDVLSQVGSAITTLVLAFKGFGVWSLVAGIISMHLFRAAGYNLASGRVILPAFRYRGAGKLANFGITITGDRILYYLYEESDKIIVGRFLGDTLLGIYSVALNLSAMVMQKVLPIITQVTFTAYSRIQNDIERIARNILNTSHAVAFVGFPLFWGMSAAAPEAIPIILGERWISITVPFQLFCLVMPLKALSVLLPPAVQAIGRPRINLVNMLLTFIVMTVAFIAGVTLGGLIGVVLAWVVAYPFIFLVTTKRCLRAIDTGLIRYMTEVTFPFVASVLMYASIYLLRLLLEASVPAYIMFMLIVTFSVIFYLSFVLIFKREDYTRLRGILQR